MKKVTLVYHIFNAIIFFALTGLLLQSCKKDKNKGGAPVITRVRAITPAPNDSTLTKVLPGQLVVIQGSNLKTVSAIYFNGVKATFNGALVADNNVVVTVPANIDFTATPPAQANIIKLVTTSGEVNFKFPIQPPPPVVTSVSYEYATPGSTLTLYGQYLYLINKISFTGGDATNIQSAADGTSLTLTIPAGATTGNILIDGQGGKTNYISYNDPTTGMLSNFDNINTYSYGSVVKNDASLFPGAMGSYAEMSTTAPLGPFDYAWYNGGRSINLSPVQWVPQANLGDPVSSYALKFEINVIKPWSGGALMIRRDEGSWQFLARYEPWKTAPRLTYTSNGWTTVVIPLTNFKSKSSLGEGTGSSAPDLTTLINATGKRPIVFMLVNDQSVAGVTPIDIAVDNIRIVKIK